MSDLPDTVDVVIVGAAPPALSGPEVARDLPAWHLLIDLRDHHGREPR